MKIVIEFYRIREADEAHAMVGRETAEAIDLADAIEIARQLSATLNMPQRPDALLITDGEGNKLYSGRLDGGGNSGARLTPNREGPQQRN